MHCPLSGLLFHSVGWFSWDLLQSVASTSGECFRSLWSLYYDLSAAAQTGAACVLSYLHPPTCALKTGRTKENSVSK